MLVAADVARRQAVAQPIARMAEELDVRLFEADLLIELTVQGLLGRLSGAHPALGKLPAAPAGAAAEEHLIAVHQHDDDVAATTVRIEDVAHVGESLPQGAPAVSYANSPCQTVWAPQHELAERGTGDRKSVG